MKKLLVLALASVSFILSTTLLYAADIKFEGDYRVRGIYSDNLSDQDDDANDQEALADGRFRVKTTATAGITTGVVTLDFANAFNDPGNAGCPSGTALDPLNAANADACGTGNYRFGTVNLGNSYNVFGVREAYLKLDLKTVKLAFGRKPVKLGHSLILDDTVDTIAAMFNAGPAEVVLANAKLLDTNRAGAGKTGGDTDLYIAKAGMKHDGHVLGAFITFLSDRGPSFLTPAAADKSTLWTVGLTGDGKFGPLSLNLEFDYLTGTEDVTAGSSIDLTGMNLLIVAGMDAGAADLSLALLYTSGEDTSATETNVNGISGNFVLGNILVNDNINSDREGQCASVAGGRIGSGAADCVGGAGVTGLKVSAGLPGFMTKNCHTEGALIWAQTTEEAAAGADKELGIEVDLNHKHKLDDNVSVGINFGYLLTGDAFKTVANTSPDNMIKGVISLNYMF
ncbi:MAG TPA: hypothetical protein VI382_07890 [Candidatus Manganitrophaceae bacterium]|nr:hypothetical protein [Candidatus Manganitrophaceae bacterium]